MSCEGQHAPSPSRVAWLSPSPYPYVYVVRVSSIVCNVSTPFQSPFFCSLFSSRKQLSLPLPVSRVSVCVLDDDMLVMMMMMMLICTLCEFPGCVLVSPRLTLGD